MSFCGKFIKKIGIPVNLGEVTVKMAEIILDITTGTDC
jgi:hypothetical protein